MILVIDNYDSFTYNLVQYLGLCDADVVVRRNDEISIEEIIEMTPDGIMLSPGPCTPKESGICLDILSDALGPNPRLKMPIFGVCLGHQAIGHVSGAVVKQAQNIMHGKSSLVEHDGKGLFTDMPNPFKAIRYHSLIITKESLPAGFIVTASSTDDHEVMGIRHESLPIEGVQFHPESVLTQEGLNIVRNFVNRVAGLPV